MEEIEKLKEQLKNCKEQLDTLRETNVDSSNNETDWKHSLANFIEKYAPLTVNFLVTAFFYFLIAISLISGTKNFWKDIPKEKVEYSKSLETFNNLIKEDSLKLDAQTQKQFHKIAIEFSKKTISNKDLKLLQSIEHLFLYLIPILLFLGIFKYYQYNYGDYFVNGYGRTDDNEKEKAEDSIKLTKTLFLSSIMSYVIIKIIEKLFFENIKDINSIISYGIFLLLIMTYLILSHNHKPPLSDKNIDH